LIASKYTGKATGRDRLRFLEEGSMHHRRHGKGFRIGLPVLFLSGLLLLGGTVQAENIYTKLSVFNQILNLVTSNYVEEVPVDSLIDGAIEGMLDQLDPHTTYVDPERYQRMQERNRGTYSGIGISFDIVDGWLTVISPLEGGPSEKLGIRPGDVIVKINGESAYGIKTEEVFEKLRGPRGTSVRVSIRREGEPELLEFTIVRDNIPIKSVPYAFMIKPGVGYIRLTRFSATTSDELEEALDRLEAEGMESLILDLRGNSGGFLNEAIEVADKFIEGGRRIVYTVGRIEGSSEEYFSTGRATHERFPLIVLVDRGSASASEIVSGAIQDWDRGLVIGEPTFGKGLVQRQFPLKNGGALLVTVARYYTPSGRLIQRDYSDREKYLHARIEEEQPDTVDISNRPVFYTAGGRRVYGGGGITPDVVVHVKWKNTPLQSALNRQRIYFDFANHYIGKHHFQWPGDFQSFRERFEVDDEMMAEFLDFLQEKGLEVTPDSLEAEREDVSRGIRAEMARNLWGDNERAQILLEADPLIAEALVYLPEAEMMARGEIPEQEPGLVEITVTQGEEPVKAQEVLPENR
jgi:carboxyl-terminal processing protease